MIQSFVENPILLLFIVVGLGYGLGSIHIRGNNLGVAAVLFVGLIFGSLSPELRIPEIITTLGLAIFIYIVGISSGPSFFSTFKRRGWQDLFFVFIMLTFSASIVAALHYLFDLDASLTSGLFVGSTTNTAALAGLLDVIGNLGYAPERAKELSENSVIGYSLSYPMGIVGPIVAIALWKRMLRIDYQREEKELRKEYPVRQDIHTLTVDISNPSVVGIPIRDLRREHGWTVLFGRYEREGKVYLATWDTEFALHDKVALLGDREEAEQCAQELGEILPYQLSYDQSEYETATMFVSNSKAAGLKLAALNLSEQFPVMVSRVTRGDLDMMANGDTVLELGDRVKVIGRRKDMKEIAQVFGDSYDDLGHINLLSFGLGMALGLILGMITFTLPGGVAFRLGFAGGPIVVGLILGGLRRSGPINWSLPYSASQTLRQVGLILLLAGIGVNSGHQFVQTLSNGGLGLWIFFGSGLISVLTVSATLLVGYKVLKIPYSILVGFVASHPAVLDFALRASKNKLPNIGYSLITPMAIVVKIVYAQLLYLLLR
jgi:putative transport protein